MRKIIILDIDGVLNNHKFMVESGSNTLDKKNVQRFNKILSKTKADVVLSSAWRYAIIGKTMTLKGFEYLLRTHGVLASINIIGTTDADEVCAHCGNTIVCNEKCEVCDKKTTRGDQITTYLKNIPTPFKYVVIDDLNLGIKEAGHPLVHTRSEIGLTEDDVNDAINILN